MFNLLVAEDDYNLRNIFRIKLTKAGYNVDLAADGEEALDKVFEKVYDILLVDVMMPKMDGFEFLDEIRKRNINTPAIMCTAKGSISDKSKGFNVGVDDYMVKPIDFDELVLRINAVLRRSKISTSKVLNIDGTILDYDTLTVSNGDTSVLLTKTEFLILFKLLSYPEKSFSKNQLFEEFWDYDSDTEENVVKVFINKIRNKVAIFPQIGIETIRGVGYRGVRSEEKG